MRTCITVGFLEEAAQASACRRWKDWSCGGSSGLGEGVTKRSRQAVHGVCTGRRGDGVEQVKGLEDLPRGPKGGYQGYLRSRVTRQLQESDLRGCIVVWGSGAGILGGCWPQILGCVTCPPPPAETPHSMFPSHRYLQPKEGLRIPAPACSVGAHAPSVLVGEAPQSNGLSYTC